MGNRNQIANLKQAYFIPEDYCGSYEKAIVKYRSQIMLKLIHEHI
jgi:hypothetical protein